MSDETKTSPSAKTATALPPPLLPHEPSGHASDHATKASVAAARQPILPAHPTGATSHAQHHVPVKSQS